MSGLHSLLSDSDSEDDPGVWTLASAAPDGGAVGASRRVQPPGSVTTRANPELHLNWGPLPAGSRATNGVCVMQSRPGSSPMDRMRPTRRTASPAEFQTRPHRSQPAGSRHESETPSERDRQVRRLMPNACRPDVPCDAHPLRRLLQNHFE